MSGQLSLWGSGQINATMFGQGALPPTSYYLALITGEAPTAYVIGEELNEPETDDYARAEMPNVASNWDNADQPNVMFYSQVVQFVPAVTDWGTVSYWALCDSEMGGNVYAIGNLDTPVTINAGDQAQMDGYELNIELGPFYTSPEA